VAAHVNPGYFYDHRLGLARDRLTAAQGCLEDAKSGEAQAQCHLGEFFLTVKACPRTSYRPSAGFERAKSRAQLRLAALRSKQKN